MSDTVDALILDLLWWLSLEERDYAEVMDAWRTSCPRLPVWEEACARGLVSREQTDRGTIIRVTACGAEFQKERMEAARCSA